MPQVTGYHRPASIEDALATLSAPGTRKVILAGGTSVNAGLDRDPIEVVDLQALGLGGIAADGDRLRIGATTTLHDIATDDATPEVLAELAVREAPSTLRAVGTVAGLVVEGDPESELLAGLLVHGATVTTVDGDGSTDRDLADVLAVVPGGIITAITIDTGGTSAAARAARTPGDRPIVAAVARNDGNAVRLALCGVASTPVLIEDVAAIDPPGDFRGSPPYRKHLAAVLAGRVLAEVGA